MGSTGSLSDWVSGVAAVTTGLGIVTFAIAPLAIPFVLLTAMAALALVLPLVALLAIAAILVAAWRGMRAAGRGFRQSAHALERPRVTRARDSASSARPCLTDGRF